MYVLFEPPVASMYYTFYFCKLQPILLYDM